MAVIWHHEVRSHECKGKKGLQSKAIRDRESIDGWHGDVPPWLSWIMENGVLEKHSLFFLDLRTKKSLDEIGWWWWRNRGSVIWSEGHDKQWQRAKSLEWERKQKKKAWEYKSDPFRQNCFHPKIPHLALWLLMFGSILRSWRGHVRHI